MLGAFLNYSPPFVYVREKWGLSLNLELSKPQDPPVSAFPALEK